MHEYYGAEEFIKSMKEHHGNEALMFSVRQGGIESVLAGMDLRMIDHLDHEAIERKYLTDDTGLLIGKMTGSFCFVSALPGANQ